MVYLKRSSSKTEHKKVYIRKIQLILKVLITAILIFSFEQCAKISAPVGGKRDVTPPVLEKSLPPNYCVNFNEKKIEIEFDEYIQLKNINQKLIVSPPLQKKPIIRIKGKGLVIDIKEKLQDSTTYSFNFGDAIADNNEGNVLNNFQFVFSTGPMLDSLTIHGQVKYAFNLQTPEEAFVLMYDDLSDSAIFKNKPLYITKINKKGFFHLNNLKADTFRLYALEDGNSNYQYDPPEPVAFVSGTLQTKPETNAPIRINDSLVSADSLPGGSLLYMFIENASKQYLKNASRTRKENLLFEFNMPPEGNVGIKFLKDTTLVHPYIEEQHQHKDSLELWLTDTALINREVLSVVLEYLMNDDEIKKDTIKIRFSKAKKKLKKGRTQKATEQAFLKLNLNAKNRKPFDINAPLYIKSPTPIEKTDSSKWHLYSIKDSLETEESLDWGKKEKQLKKIILPYTWIPDTKYSMVLYPGAITDIYNLTNDTLNLTFTTRKEEYYGRIILELNQITELIQIQLLDSKEKVIRQIQVQSDTTLLFDFLPPGEFLIKSFLDENKNGKWDTGSILKKIQPEKVIYYGEKIKVRSNWDFKKTWSPKFYTEDNK